MRANCNKEVGTNAKRGNFSIDLVKPEHWHAPDLTDLVNIENRQIEMWDYKHEDLPNGC